MTELGTLCDDEIERKADILRQQDSFGMLSQSGEWGVWNHYLYELASIQVIAEKSGLNLDETLMFEFGAHQYEVGLTINTNAVNPSIAHFFALSENKNYHAIDIGYNSDKLKKRMEITKKMLNDEFIQSCGLLTPYNSIDLTLLERRIEEISLDYSPAKKIINESSKKSTTLICSNQVFNDPRVNLEFDYWNLPGIHVHLSEKHESEGKINASADKNPAIHKKIFKKYFKIEKEIEMLQIPYRNGSIIYTWKN